MVIPDWTSPKPQKTELVMAPRYDAMARPLDRLAAVIVDVFVLLVPIYILLSAPLKRGLTASFILGSEPDFEAMLFLMVLVALVLLVAYQTLMHFFFGATFGKMLFDLRIKSMFGEEHLTFTQCLVRSVLWISEFICLCLPMLSVFSNRQRRTLHDRVTDTCVVSRSGAGISAPAAWERGLVRGFFGASLMFVLMLTMVQTRRLFERVKSEKGLSTIVEKEAGECDVVSKNLSSDDEEGHHRLELAMSLYAAGLAERTCLEAELEREISTQVPVGPITYLAQAFVNADDAEVSNSYLDQVCEDAPHAVECSMSKVVSRWSEEDWDSVEKLLDSAEKGSGYLEVWAVRHYMKQAHYSQALNYLDSLSGHRELAEFSLVQRVKAFYNSYMESEATAALAQAIPALEKEEAEDLSAWMCAQQLQNGCAALQKVSCRDIPATKESSEIDFEHSASALSRIMALECQGGEGMDYQTFGDAVHDEDWQNFFRANLKRQKEDLHASFRLFADVITSNSTPELLRVEALRRLSQFANHQQMIELTEMWRGFESKDAWTKAGNILFTRFVQKKDQESAMRVAGFLMNADAMSPKSLAQLNTIEHSAHSARMPASLGDK